MFDLKPAANEMARIASNITDEQLGAPTPCHNSSVATVLDHVVELAAAFTGAAHKEPGPVPPDMSADHLDPNWREVLPSNLNDLAEGWRDLNSWEGEAEAGGVTWPAEEMAVVVLNELVVHGWDLAAATDQDTHFDDTSTQIALGFETEMAKPEWTEQRATIFGPIVDISKSAPTMDRIIALSGRTPDWSP